MEPQDEIIVHLERVDQLIEPSFPSPFQKQRLRQDAEKFIVEKVMNLPRKGGIKLLIYLPKSETAEAGDVPNVFHQHFAYRRGEAEKEVRRMLRLGCRSLAIASVFLGVVILVVEIITLSAPAGYIPVVIREGLTILGWVALWRPAELLLYEWYPSKRDARLFGRLEHANIQVLMEPRETTQ